VIEIGSHRFDPKVEASKARRRADSDRKRLAAALNLPPKAIPGTERELWIVQFADDPDLNTITRCRKKYGLRLTGGLSSITFIESMTRATADSVRRESQVRSCIAYWSDLKMARSSLAPSEEITGERLLRLGLVVTPTETLQQKLALLGFPPNGDAGLYPGGFLLRVKGQPGADPTNLLRLDEVEWVEDVRGYVPTNASSSQVVQGGGGGSTPIWDKGLHGEEQIIGIFDLDVPDMGHDFFRDPVINAASPNHRKVLAIQSPSTSFLNSHATMVCGCAAGDDVNSPGSHADRGGAWAAKIVYTDINPLPAQIDEELRASAGLGAIVHSMSFAEGLTDGSKPAPYTAESEAFDRELWRNEGLLVVAAVTNTAPCLNQPFGGAPGTAKNSLAVAGTRDVPNQNDFHTGRTGTADGRRKPDLVAVGEGVRSSDLTTWTDSAVISTNCGTSFATPHVAAAAALVRQYFVEGWYPTGKKTDGGQVTPSGALLKAVLLNATVDLTGVPGYPSVREGWGRLQLDRALHFDGDKVFLRVKDVPHLFGFDRGGAKTFILHVPRNAKSMKITLVFNDPAGAVGANDPVVNHLDLMVMEPMRSRWDGWEFGYFGNDFNNNKVTIRRPLQTGVTKFPPNPAELKNNVRQVVVDAPAAGRWGLAVFSHKFDNANTPTELRRGRKAQGYAWVARADLY